MAKIMLLDEIDADYIAKKIKVGSVFIYPTDTIYGLGCDALNPEAVNRIRDIKERFDKPLSVIAPSKQWITDNFKVSKSFIDKLPGPFTYVMEPKKSNLVCKEVTKGNIGVRIPDHPFTKIVQKAKLPFVTTSVNVTGKKPYLDIKKIPRSITSKVDFIIDGGILDNPPSTVIDMTGKLPKILR
ncbi:MAG: L-threonylcarbamoyladenylate synthase [Candidatus Woesearchaeota archaeon]